MVSVIIPIYNSEDKLERCVKSVLDQTYKDFEVLLIDDGSKDGSLKICEKFATEDERVRVISKENEGVSATRNRGIDLAKGEYIQFLDSDDYIAPDMMELLVTRMEETKADVVVSGYTEIRAEGRKDILPGYAGSCNVTELQQEYPNIFGIVILNAIWNKMYRRDRIQGIRFHEDISLGEDLIFNLEYLKKSGNLSFIQSPLYRYDIREESLNTKFRENSIELAKGIYQESMSFAKEVGLQEPSCEQISNTFIQYFFYGILDFYVKTDKSNKELKQCIKKWVADPELLAAANHAKMPRVYEKAAQIFVKHKSVFLLHFMFCVRRYMYLRDKKKKV